MNVEITFSLILTCSSSNQIFQPENSANALSNRAQPMKSKHELLVNKKTESLHY